jgi:hypothetical protein
MENPSQHVYETGAPCVLLLTLVHEPASVLPATLVKYLPALHAIHDDALLDENCPLGHCNIRVCMYVCMYVCQGMHIVKELKQNMWAQLSQLWLFHFTTHIFSFNSPFRVLCLL